MLIDVGMAAKRGGERHSSRGTEAPFSWHGLDGHKM